ncbi:MAG: [acyl-carrier-protein] S-malonyltransferase [Micromonosporaceae bacterium]|jgi:[acyl-carrier-protein] S-malonyltransferase|nr:[acyl-carrier-protein] S-malonyltransferase [Micromonosporaceae bacterium]
MTDTSTEVAAWVGGRPIPVALITERLAALRAGPYAARLPHPGTADWRNLRRWLVQAVTTEAVIEHEAAERGITTDLSDGPPRPVTLAEALRVGGVTAAIVASHPRARALRRHVMPDVAVSDAETFAYYRRNRDRHPEPYEQVRARIAADLGRADRDRRFTRWLDERCAALVRLEPGFEHPGDPRHPDAVHRH